MFIDDREKMKDFIKLKKNEFLESYSYLNEDEYDLTAQELEKFFEKICRNCIETLNLEWVIWNHEVIHGYFADDIYAERFEHGKVLDIESNNQRRLAEIRKQLAYIRRRNRVCMVIGSDNEIENLIDERTTLTKELKNLRNKKKYTAEDIYDLMCGNNVYTYNSWKDFYEGYVKDQIMYDLSDIGIEDFYISKEDLDYLNEIF